MQAALFRHQHECNGGTTVSSPCTHARTQLEKEGMAHIKQGPSGLVKLSEDIAQRWWLLRQARLAEKLDLNPLKMEFKEGRCGRAWWWQARWWRRCSALHG